MGRLEQSVPTNERGNMFRAYMFLNKLSTKKQWVYNNRLIQWLRLKGLSYYYFKNQKFDDDVFLIQ